MVVARANTRQCAPSEDTLRQERGQENGVGRQWDRQLAARHRLTAIHTGGAGGVAGRGRSMPPKAQEGKTPQRELT